MKTIRKIIFYSIWYPFFSVLLRSSHRSRVLIYSSGNKLLCIKDPINNGRWRLPGGGIKKRESPIEGAKREVEEELGFNLERTDLKFIKKVKFKHLLSNLDLSIFTVHLESDPILKLNKLEIAEAEWIDISNLNQKTASSELLFCLENLLQ